MKFKILTYNIWNSDENFNERLELLKKEIARINPDIIALQEVRNEKVVEFINTGYEHVYFKKYFDCEEGLAILSKVRFLHKASNWDDTEDVHNSGVLRTILDLDTLKLGFTNVHLDYESALNREIEIVKAIKMIETNEGDYEILLGDFNCRPSSSIYRYITGEQSLQGHATNWIDLAEARGCITGDKPEITIDFLNNPRWKDDKSISIPARFDLIMLKEPYPNKSPKLNYLEVVGKEIVDGITPSDHYGVVCELEFD